MSKAPFTEELMFMWHFPHPNSNKSSCPLEATSAKKELPIDTPGLFALGCLRFEVRPCSLETIHLGEGTVNDLHFGAGGGSGTASTLVAMASTGGWGMD